MLHPEEHCLFIWYFSIREEHRHIEGKGGIKTEHSWIYNENVTSKQNVHSCEVFGKNCFGLNSSLQLWLFVTRLWKNQPQILDFRWKLQSALPHGQVSLDSSRLLRLGLSKMPPVGEAAPTLPHFRCFVFDVYKTTVTDGVWSFSGRNCLRDIGMFLESSVQRERGRERERFNSQKRVNSHRRTKTNRT